jgi:hypothetical protein
MDSDSSTDVYEVCVRPVELPPKSLESQLFELVTTPISQGDTEPVFNAWDKILELVISAPKWEKDLLEIRVEDVQVMLDGMQLVSALFTIVRVMQPIFNLSGLIAETWTMLFDEKASIS